MIALSIAQGCGRRQVLPSVHAFSKTECAQNHNNASDEE